MAERTNPQIKKNGVAVGRSYEINFIEGANVTLTASASDQSTNVTIASAGGMTPTIQSRSATLFNSAGITETVNLIIWRAPFACTVTAVYGYRVGGTGATINARRNGSSNHLASALSVTSADTWMDGGSVQNTAYAAGDKMEAMIVSVAGNPTQVAVQIDIQPS